MTVLFSAAPGYCARFGVAVLLVVLADFFFYGQPAGITVFLFAILIAAAVVAVHPTAFSDSRLWLKPLALLVALLPLAENVSALSVSIALVALAVFALSRSGRLRHRIARIAGQIALFGLAAPFRFASDFIRWRRTAHRFGGRRVRLAAIAVWVMPMTLGAVFLALFGAANPVIDYWLSLIDLLKLLDLIQLTRIAFWLFVLAGVWAFLRPRLPRVSRRIPCAMPPPAVSAQSGKTVTTVEDILFGKPAILRALVIFNILFALQTGLDATYLWGGAALPDGLSYAAYAHRGAYPLIVTALLAAGFVLAALRPGGATSAETYWRVAAFVWMGLVAAGLALIVAHIALGKSNEWLLSANLLTLSATLYAGCFINFAALIANYNVDHSLEMTGQGISLDAWYLRSLGPGAFPALDRFLDHQSRTAAANDPVFRQLAGVRGSDEGWYRTLQQNWRAWSFRDWRLLAYLDTRGLSWFLRVLNLCRAADHAASHPRRRR
ncbi:DUF4173 domain-containing protein [Mesorhizobium sp. AR07]|uniref:DUF4153 domain-containing protein n=1 Tax=Mesorhizobium sp. AR07 TaxID=2865838 RepID=UPI0021FB3F49|nr:DUF4173 domain-containing protein [Mesorhizobium sp. AR07]UVK42619.1 DUF4173 domain-containing protein [Mesorhizobium sp. AR07]